MKRLIGALLCKSRKGEKTAVTANLPAPEFDPATMDIAEVLRRPMRMTSTAIVQEFSDGTQKIFDPTRLAAADEIERLRKVVSGVRYQLPQIQDAIIDKIVVGGKNIEAGRN
jgi:hypothetical protein